jgi:hypothetical protein
VRLFRRAALSIAAIVFIIFMGLEIRSAFQPSAEDAARGIVALAKDRVAIAPGFVSPERAVCRDRNRLRNAYFGALHIHTDLSFDSWVFENPNGPNDAYGFTRDGQTLRLPPLDAQGKGTRELTLDRPLDFAAVTDHSEMLGEVALCTMPESPMYDHDICQRYRGESVLDWLIPTPAKYLARIFSIVPSKAGAPSSELCGEDRRLCQHYAVGPWEQTQRAAEAWYDRTAECRFTTFVGYEYSLVTPEFNNLHRNVLFRSGTVPPLPISAREAPEPADLWRALKKTCIDGHPECDVLAIPHNSNWSGGRMFDTEYGGAASVSQQAALATLRSDLEPLVEIFQVKGDSECRNGLYGVQGGPDELCDFEKLRRVDVPQENCDGGYSAGGMRLEGCVPRRNYTRYALVEGIKEEQRLGVNPFKFGLIAATDTHNGAGGAVREDLYQGATGMLDADPEVRLAELIRVPGGGKATGSPLRNNPGGLAGIWAEENTRESLFDAMKRREVFGTSGPRIRPRLFASWGFGVDLCRAHDAVERGYSEGVPMGSDLPARPEGDAVPEFFVSALADPEGGSLQRIQIVKVWAGPEDVMHQAVYDIAGTRAPETALNLETCEVAGDATTRLCAQWRDPKFDSSVDAVYYARVLESPTCRWSHHLCNRLRGEARPAACDALSTPASLQERAWTSPVWYRSP